MVKQKASKDFVHQRKVGMDMSNLFLQIQSETKVPREFK